MTLRTEILQLIDDPTHAYVVLIAGGILLIGEFLRPGRVVPGVGGAVLVTLALHALVQWQWSTQGATMLIVSLFIAISSLRSQSYIPHLTCGVTWTVGTLLLISDGKRIHEMAALAGGVLAFSFSWLLTIAYRARKSKRIIEYHG